MQKEHELLMKLTAECQSNGFQPAGLKEAIHLLEQRTPYKLVNEPNYLNHGMVKWRPKDDAEKEISYRKLYVVIETSNAAFEGGARDLECARILRELADKLERDDLEGDGRTLMDVNGNSVGLAIFREEYDPTMD